MRHYLVRLRDPHPVAVVQPQDAQSDCAMIRAEIEANNIQAEKLAEENHAKIVQTVAAGVSGCLAAAPFSGSPGAAGLRDFSSADMGLNWRTRRAAASGRDAV